MADYTLPTRGTKPWDTILAAAFAAINDELEQATARLVATGDDALVVQSDVEALITEQIDTSPTIAAAIAAATGAVVDGAPANLNTLKELATAINNDPAFYTTITTAIGLKISTTAKGVANGVASLDGAGLLPDAQSPTRLSAAALDVKYKNGNRRVVVVDDLPTVNLWSAHRGGGGNPYYAFDGSRSAYRVAMALGASMIDIDEHLTSDSVPVVLHDDTVDRTTASTGYVADYAFSLLPNLDMRYASGNGWDPEPIPTIEEVVSEFGGRVVLTIEAKDGSASVAHLAALFKKYGLERSCFINTASAPVVQTIVAAGCVAHMYGITSVTGVQAADAAGAFLIEVPYNASTAIMAAVAAAVNIKRVITGPIYRRADKALMPAGLNGWVSNGVGYLDKVDNRKSIAQEVAKKRIGPGWRNNATKTYPMFDPAEDGVVLSQEGGTGAGANRIFMPGTLAGPKPATHQRLITVKMGAFVADNNTRLHVRLCCTSDVGTGSDTDSNGYVVGPRKTGVLNLWTSNPAFGAATLLASPPSPPWGDAAVTLAFRFDVDATTIGYSRRDITACTLSSALTSGAAITALPVTALTVAVPSGAKLLLPNGDYVTVTATAAVTATTIAISSYTPSDTVASASALYFGTGKIANTDWRGDYAWATGTSGGAILHKAYLLDILQTP